MYLSLQSKKPSELAKYAIAQREVLFDINLLSLVKSILQKLTETLSLDSVYQELVYLCFLLEMKSKLLLPASEEEEDDESLNVKDEETPDISQRISAYKSIRKTVELLNSMLRHQAKYLPPLKPPEQSKEVVYALKDVSLYDLINAFNEVISRLEQPPVLNFIEEDYPYEVVYKEIYGSIKSSKEGIPIIGLLTMRMNLSWVVSAFTVILDLINSGNVFFTRDGNNFILFEARTAA